MQYGYFTYGQIKSVWDGIMVIECGLEGSKKKEEANVPTFKEGVKVDVKVKRKV